jgi:hypothetical protein
MICKLYYRVVCGQESTKSDRAAMYLVQSGKYDFKVIHDIGGTSGDALESSIDVRELSVPVPTSSAEHPAILFSM